MVKDNPFKVGDWVLLKGGVIPRLVIDVYDIYIDLYFDDDTIGKGFYARNYVLYEGETPDW